jgi:hypothetical protein
MILGFILGLFVGEMSAFAVVALLNRADPLRSMLHEVYRPEGVEIWLQARHREWGGLTVAEMRSAGRGDEVLAAAERLATAFS